MEQVECKIIMSKETINGNAQWNMEWRDQESLRLCCQVKSSQVPTLHTIQNSLPLVPGAGAGSSSSSRRCRQNWTALTRELKLKMLLKIHVKVSMVINSSVFFSIWWWNEGRGKFMKPFHLEDWIFIQHTTSTSDFGSSDFRKIRMFLNKKTKNKKQEYSQRDFRDYIWIFFFFSISSDICISSSLTSD